MPSINDLPILHSSDPQYHAASVKLQQALFLQAGITQQYNQVASNINAKVNIYAEKMQLELAEAIEENTSLDPKVVFFTSALAYGAFVRKEVTRNFKNPWFREVTHTVTIGEDRYLAGIKVPF